MLRNLPRSMPPLFRICVVMGLLMSGTSNASAQSQLITHLAAGQHQTVVYYGTSLTAGGAWTSQLTNWLQAQYGSSLVTAYNSGMSGDASNTGVTNLNSKVIAHHPDTVFIEFATNDSFTAYATNDADYNITPQKSKDNLSTMIDAILADNPQTEIILQTMNPAWDAPNGNQSGSKRPNLPDYFQGYRDVAAARNLLLIDNYPNWLDLQTNNPALFDSYIADGVHPNATGYQNIVTPVIENALLTAPEPASGLIIVAGASAALLGGRRKSSVKASR